MQGPEVAGALASILIGLVCFLGIGTLIGAIILRAACWAYNKLCQPDNRVDEPNFGKSLLMALAFTAVQLVVGFGIGLVFGTGLAAAGVDRWQAQLILQAISLPVGILILAGTITLLLPTTFVRGLLIALLYLAIGIAVAMVIGGLILMLVLAVRAVS
jgi:hypothetical protein